MTQALLSLSPRGAPTTRYYQDEAKASFLRGIAEGAKSQLIVMATGLGKSVLFGAIVREFPGNVLVLAHREELLEQGRRHVEAATGEQAEIEQADLRSSNGCRIVVGSVQSVSRPNRLTRMGKDRFRLIIVDEAHHAVAPSYQAVLDWFDCPTLGLTATPDRQDEAALGKVFDRVAYTMDIQEGVEQGWLVPIVGQRVVLDDIKLDGVKVTAGDLAAGELDEVMLRSVEGIVHETLRLAGDRQGIAFFPGVKSAALAAQRFNAQRANAACFVSGETPKDERRQIIADFRRGVYQYLCNCQVATEGFDVPEASVIIQGRPTLSRALYAQMIGRGARPLAGTVDVVPGRDQETDRRGRILASPKPDCLILDMVGNSAKHTLMGPEDVLGGNFDPAVVAEAKKRIKPGGDVLQALKEAQRQVAIDMAKAKATVVSRVTKFDPFGIWGVQVSEEERYAVRFGTKPATEKQLEILHAKGISTTDTEGLSKMAASRLLNEMALRARKNLATYKQCRQLEKFGVKAQNVSFSRARQALDYIASTGWGRHAVDPQKLHRICFSARQPGEEG